MNNKAKLYESNLMKKNLRQTSKDLIFSAKVCCLHFRLSISRSWDCSKNLAIKNEIPAIDFGRQHKLDQIYNKGVRWEREWVETWKKFWCSPWVRKLLGLLPSRCLETNWLISWVERSGNYTSRWKKKRGGGGVLSSSCACQNSMEAGNCKEKGHCP